MKLFCLSGLGVDERAFKNISINDVELIHIPWIEPFKNESLENYSKRLLLTQNIPENCNLLGVSFGGMVAQEIAKIIKPKKLFIISSIKGNSDLPAILKAFGNIGLNRLIPSSFLKWANPFTFYFFGVKEPENKSLLKQILKETDSTFLKWAMNAILKWDSKIELDAVRIHGDNDKLLPPINPNFSIKNGGHFMIISKANEISKIIETQIKSA